MLVGVCVIEVLTSQITLACVRLTNKQTTTKTKQNTNQDKKAIPLKHRMGNIQVKDFSNPSDR